MLEDSQEQSSLPYCDLWHNLAQQPHNHATNSNHYPPPPNMDHKLPQPHNKSSIEQDAICNHEPNRKTVEVVSKSSFLPTNNQLKHRPNTRSHATTTGQMTNNVGISEMMLNNAKEKEHVTRQSPYEQPLAINATNMVRRKHLDSDVESDIDDNTILYHQYQLDSDVQDVPTEVSSAPPGEISMITILDTENPIDGHHKVENIDLDQTIIQRNKRNAELEEENVLLKSKLSQNVVSINSLKNESKKVVSEKKVLEDNEDSLVHAEVSRTKMSTRLGIIKPIKYAKLNALYSHFVPQKELSREHVYWLPAEELATQIKVTEYMRIFDELDTEYERCVLANKNLNIERKNLLIQNDCLIANSLEKDICSIELAQILVGPLLKDQLQGKDDTIRNLQTQINITRMLNVGSTVGSFDKQALETELNQLKDTLTSVIIQIDGYKAKNVNLKRRYEELLNSNTYSRSTFTAKINALTAENAKLKTELISKISSGPTASEKPKVIAPGMYSISPKYIPPQRRVNRAIPTLLLKKHLETNWKGVDSLSHSGTPKDDICSADCKLIDQKACVSKGYNTHSVYVHGHLVERTSSIRESDTSVLEDLKALSWKTCQEGSLLNLSDHRSKELKKKDHKSFHDYCKYEHVGPKFSEWRIEEKIISGDDQVCGAAVVVRVEMNGEEAAVVVWHAEVEVVTMA
ncbi:hypothetical protein Tco_0560743 [Tanacetum coccineum]